VSLAIVVQHLDFVRCRTRCANDTKRFDTRRLEVASERVPELAEDEDIVDMCKGALMTREKENVEGDYDILICFQCPSYTERV
jgi:hypothetical protein